MTLPGYLVDAARHGVLQGSRIQAQKRCTICSEDMPQDAKTDEEIESCFDVMSELRPHLGRDDFLATVRHMQAEGYRLAFIRENERVVAVAGYRILTSLLMGKHLYIDDLVSSQESRSRGFGEEMIKWLRTRAKANRCNYINLDSGIQRDRAHKFYFTQGFSIAFYHFNEKLSGGT